MAPLWALSQPEVILCGISKPVKKNLFPLSATVSLALHAVSVEIYLRFPNMALILTFVSSERPPEH